jgi:hypothetical protein
MWYGSPEDREHPVFSLELALKMQRALAIQLHELAQRSRSESMETRMQARETIAQSRELMASIDRQLRVPVS